jgi:4'-phosphopantetheinyl transferase EntD
MHFLHYNKKPEQQLALFYQHNINASTRLGIWHIEEDENFFTQHVPLKKDITHPHKRLQHLAGRYLLKYLFPDFPYAEIVIADTRKPYLPDELYHFSISHCGNFAAAIVSTNQQVGIDIEIPSSKVERVQHKFLHDNEVEFLNSFVNMGKHFRVEMLTIFWSCKEALYKWYGLGEVNFKDCMYLNGNLVFGADDIIDLPYTFCKGSSNNVQLKARIFEDIVLSWTATS